MLAAKQISPGGLGFRSRKVFLWLRLPFKLMERANEGSAVSSAGSSKSSTSSEAKSL